LQRFVEDKPIKARQVSRSERLWRWCRRNPALAASSAVAAAGLVAVTVFAVLFAVVQANNAAEQARTNAALLKEQDQTRTEKERAEKLASELSAALQETRKHEALLAVEKGHMLIGQGQLYPGMLWLCRGLEKAPADAVDLRDGIRTGLASLRNEAPVLRAVFTPGSGATAAAYRPASKAILVGNGYDANKGEARLYDARTGKPLGPPLPHADQVLSVAFSPDGKTILTGSGTFRTHTGEARLWDARTGKPLGPPLRHVDRVWAVAFSPDGKSFLTGTADFQAYKGEVCWWETAGGKLRSRPMPQFGMILDLAFSPDGKFFAVVSYNMESQKGALALWSTATGQPLGPPWIDTSLIGAIAFAPDGKTIVLGTGDLRAAKGEVRFWDIASRKLASRALPQAGVPTSVAFSPDGRLLVTSSVDPRSRKGEVRLWEAATGKPVGMPIGQRGMFLRAAFSPDGRSLLSTGFENSSYVWELPTDRLIGPLLSHQEEVSAVALSPDGQMMVTGSGQGKRGVAQRWQAATGQPIGLPLPQPGYVLAAAFSRDGRRLATGTGYVGMDYGEAQVWDPATGRALSGPQVHGNDVTAVAFSPDGGRLLTGSLDGTVRLWDTTTGRPIGAPLVHSGRVSCVAFHPGGRLILTGCKQITASGAGGGQARTSLWEVAVFARRPRSFEQRWESARVPPPSGERARDEGRAREERKPQWFAEHQGDVTAVAFSPDGKMFATGCADHLAQLWDTATTKPIGVPFDHPDNVTAVAFSPDGKLLLTGCRDRVARLWDARTGLALGTGLRHPEAVTCVAFGRDGQTLLTGCQDGLARVWDAATQVSGPNARLVRWVEVQSGWELSPEGVLRALPEAEWQKRRKRLAALGGPLEGRAGPLSWHLQQAVARIAGGDWPAALWQLSRQIHDQPRDALAHVLRVQVQLALDHPERAAADFDRAVALGPAESTLPALQAFAVQAVARKQRAQALWYLDRLVRAEPGQAFAWLERGRLEAAASQWKRAARDMARGVDLDPSDHWNWVQALPLQLYVGEIAEYRRLCRAMVQRFGDTEALQIGERMVKACALLPDSRVDPRQFLRIADRVVKAGANSPLLPYFELIKGMAEYRAGRWARAAVWLQKSPQFSNWNRNLPAQALLALAYHRLGQSDRARQALERARGMRDQLPKVGEESFPTYNFNDWLIGHMVYREAAAILDVPHRREAEEALRKQQWADAVTHLTHLIEADPAFWPDLVARSIAYAEKGRAAEAKVDFGRAVELAGEAPDPWLQRGRFYAGLKRYEEAAGDFVRALDGTSGARREGEHEAVLGELLETPSLLAKVLERRPREPGVWRAHARMEIAKGEWAKVLADYDKILELAPHDLNLRLDRGRCLARLGRWRESASEYARGMESRPRDSFLWHEAAMSYLMAGETDRYRGLCERMLEQFGDTKDDETVVRLVYTLLQAPRPVADMGRLVRLAEINANRGPGYGAALYRAGKVKEAIEDLEQKAALGSGQGRAWPRLFLAMAHARLGHVAAARQYLEKAKEWIAEADRNAKLYLFWVQRLEFEVLRKEAERLVNEGPRR
jgi:WD40 repeat protein/tetratricopeptide (TPR) repeat protein